MIGPVDQPLERLRLRRERYGVSRDFGEGWLSAAAHDELQIALLFRGFPRDLTARRLVLASARQAGSSAGRTNVRTVRRVLKEINDELGIEPADKDWSDAP